MDLLRLCGPGWGGPPHARRFAVLADFSSLLNDRCFMGLDPELAGDCLAAVLRLGNEDWTVRKW